MVEEEKAIQAATLASLNLDTINKNWNEKIKEEAKEFSLYGHHKSITSSLKLASVV